MDEVLKYLARALVDNPDQVTVETRDSDRGPVLELRVAPEDLGRVIGRQGRIAKALRTVVKAAATRHGERVSVEIAE